MAKRILILTDTEEDAWKIDKILKRVSIYFAPLMGYINENLKVADRVVFKGRQFDRVYNAEFVNENYTVFENPDSTIVSSITHEWELRKQEYLPEFRVLMHQLRDFGLKVAKYSERPVFTIYHNQGEISHSYTRPEHLKEAIPRLMKDVSNLNAKISLSKTFNNLWFSVDDKSITVWVKTDHEGIFRDGTSVGTFNKDSEELSFDLAKADVEASYSRQKGWFYCSKCRTAYLREHYGYFYFAATYCITCMKADPEWERKARAERYN